MNPPVEQITAQGYDLQFGTNVLGTLCDIHVRHPRLTFSAGHFYLTKLLVPVLLSTFQATGVKTRVVHTSSIAAMNAKGVDFETLKDGPVRRKKGNADKLYPQSKLVRLQPLGLPLGSFLTRCVQGNVIVSNEFARRYGDQGLISSSCEPGLLKTDLQRHSSLVTCVAVSEPLRFLSFQSDIPFCCSKGCDVLPGCYGSFDPAVGGYDRRGLEYEWESGSNFSPQSLQAKCLNSTSFPGQGMAR
jgi:NAD(P)-dependent dehydrogenase (short-subunit alcohol dehydrogenase family)